MAHILAIRFSALGDVAMTIPVLWSFATQYPEHEITLLSRTNVAPLFNRMPKNIHFLGVDLKEYQGIKGLHRLFSILLEKKFDAIADLHDVLRTKYIRFAFYDKGLPVEKIQKGRYEKYKLSHHLQFKQLQSTIDRYLDVFQRLGFPITPTFSTIFNEDIELDSAILEHTGIKGKYEWIGIAPFAKHKGKIYPLHLMEEVIRLLNNEENDRKIFLFGFGKEEQNWCLKMEGKYSKVKSLVQLMSMDKELELMSCLDTMITMDSANMHLASLVGTPSISVWGATHPYAGFSGWALPLSKQIQVDLDCRPCSIYGNKPCKRKQQDCMLSILPATIVENVKDLLKARKTNSN